MPETFSGPRCKNTTEYAWIQDFISFSPNAMHPVFQHPQSNGNIQMYSRNQWVHTKLTNFSCLYATERHTRQQHSNGVPNESKKWENCLGPNFFYIFTFIYLTSRQVDWLLSLWPSKKREWRRKHREKERKGERWRERDPSRDDVRSRNGVPIFQRNRKHTQKMSRGYVLKYAWPPKCSIR